MKELEKKYDHLKVEANKNQMWIDKKYFQEHDLNKEPFTIVIPPPNVTGKLHLGHAWDTTLQDILIRYKKLQGYDVLWMPGMDHAGISTQAKVEEKLRAQGISRYDLGREKFLEQAWDWKEEYAQVIREQWGKLGLALDYQKERFTLDEGCYAAVLKVFVDLYNKGLIYRKERIINWDPFTKTALSNIEVDHLEVDGQEHYFKYYINDGSGDYLEVMTTRPETIFGDVALAVNPKDERYQKYIGKTALIPLTNLEIAIIEDDYVEVDSGTGVVKITPAHDPNDFMVGERHNLEHRIIIDDEAKMMANEWVLEEFHGLDRFEARKLFIEKAQAADLVTKLVPIKHNVGHSQRSGVIVEPILSLQWFVDMQQLAEKAIKYQESAEGVNFIPERFEKTFLQWMENIEDWCISRQLWWGHRIPAWYHKETGEIYVDVKPPIDIENYVQDEDVLDTWFSSGLWPFETLGWPLDDKDLNRYFPTDVLVTGYDIIFFWVARMIFTSLEFLDDKPFKDVLIHGLVRDEQGRKMSKSLGNGIDPMEVIDQYGADALRYFLCTSSSPGQDLRFSIEKIEASWNFINKLWNASRFVQMNIDGTVDLNKIAIDELNPADKWILTRLNETILEVTTNMDKYEFTIVGNALYKFIWDDFCSWYVEMAKASIDSPATKATLKYVLKAILLMINPFMPFVSEEIFTSIYDEDSIVYQDYPQVNEEFNFNNEEIIIAMELISIFREFRLENNIKRAIAVDYHLNYQVANIQDYISKLTNFNFVDDLKGDYLSFALSSGINVDISSSMIEQKSNESLIEEYQVQLEHIKAEINRAEKMLANENFIKKAPADKIEAEKSKLSDYQAQYESVMELLNKIK